MSWLEFIASVIGSLAWPSAIVICVLLFRKRLLALLPLLKLSKGGWEAYFEERLERAEGEASQLAPTVGEAPPTPEETERFEEMARLSPRAGVLELRAKLDTSLRELAQQAGISTWQRGSPTTLIRELRSKEKIDPATSALLDELRNIGNAAAHPSTDQQITIEDARRYRDLTDRALASIEWSRMRPFITP